mmetsp:Transcript_20678/g.62913  ORF Transcript_20678/g.62913 Transcript_20678/m.62913 type:complete len:335 (+) Transcript_20678:120-1124(+)
MTFLGETNEDYETVIYGVYIAVLAIDAAVLMYYSCRFHPAVLGVIVASLMIFENAVLLAGDGVDQDGQLAKVTSGVHACIIPGILLFFYETAYLVHKRRSVKFCCITFDEGHRRSYSLKSFAARHSTQVVAILLLVTNILVNFDLLKIEDDTAGQTGYADLTDGDHNEHVFFALVPSMVLAVYVLYFGIALWKYGTSISLTVYSSRANPWVITLIGAIGQVVGQSFSGSVYPVTSNGGEAFLLTTIVALIPHMVRDIEDLEKFAEYLEDAEEGKTLDGSIGSSIAPSSHAGSHSGHGGNSAPHKPNPIGGLPKLQSNGVAVLSVAQAANAESML